MSSNRLRGLTLRYFNVRGLNPQKFQEYVSKPLETDMVQVVCCSETMYSNNSHYMESPLTIGETDRNTTKSGGARGGCAIFSKPNVAKPLISAFIPA